MITKETLKKITPMLVGYEHAKDGVWLGHTQAEHDKVVNDLNIIKIKRELEPNDDQSRFYVIIEDSCSGKAMFRWKDASVWTILSDTLG